MARDTCDEKKKSGLFDDLSLPQVIAGALAAVTSMLLASQIGIYGSVIGVGVGSVVSAVASQLYKKFLQRSAEKLRELKPGETGQDKPIPARRAATPSLDDAAQQGDATARRVRAKREHKRKVERGVVIVSIVSAILAVLVSGGVVYFATQGQGVGAKTAPIVAPQPKADSQASGGGESSSGSGDAASSGGSAEGSKDQAGTDGSKDASSSDGSSGADDQQGSGSSGSSDGSGSDSGNGSGSGSGTSDGGGSESGGSNFGEGSSGSSGSDDAGSGDSSGSSGSSKSLGASGLA